MNILWMASENFTRKRQVNIQNQGSFYQNHMRQPYKQWPAKFRKNVQFIHVIDFPNQMDKD